jgi:hypothetical protein
MSNESEHRIDQAMRGRWFVSTWESVSRESAFMELVENYQHRLKIHPSFSKPIEFARQCEVRLKPGSEKSRERDYNEDSRAPQTRR